MYAPQAPRLVLGPAIGWVIDTQPAVRPSEVKVVRFLKKAPASRRMSRDKARLSPRQRRSRLLPLLLLVGGVGLFSAPLVSSQSPVNSGTPADLRIEPWQASWNAVLARDVDATGRVDFAGLTQDHAKLDEVIKFIEAVDPVSTPSLFPTANAQLAYYIDAYNALAMHGVLEVGVPVRFDWLSRIRFFYMRKVLMGGRSLSLYSLENDIIRPRGDPRVHFALNCMSVSCPRLFKTAFAASDLDHQLDAAAREFVNEERNVRTDPVRQVATLSAIFKFYTKDFLAQSASLIDYVNRYRTQTIPHNYQVIFADYDWTINDQSRLAR